MTRVVACGGVDSSGGAGLDADREMALALGAEIVEVATCHTVQDAARVRSVTPVEGWPANLSPADAWKFGLLPGAESVRAAAGVARGASFPIVVDPVLAASSGYVFLDEEARRALREDLISEGVVLTPNLPEAAALTGCADPLEAGLALLGMGAAGVVVKGGHGKDAEVRELVLAPGADPRWIEHERMPGTLRGTGCRFATALAVHLAQGRDLAEAARLSSLAVAARIAAG